jgi:hypothetical protein
VEGMLQFSLRDTTCIGRTTRMIPQSAKSPSPVSRRVGLFKLARRNMTATESKDLEKGTRVYWRGDAADSGTITEKSWDAVTISWDNGHVAIVHHGDMSDILRASRSLPKA